MNAHGTTSRRPPAGEQRTETAARRDAATTAALLLAAIAAGSGGFAHFDWALVGYCAATLAALTALAYQASLFWRRRPSAFYGRALLRGLRRPQSLRNVLQSGARDVGAQRFLFRRGVLRWLAHMCLSWGTLVAFGITVPLVFGWLHFEAAGASAYRVVFFSIPLLAFDVRGAFAWLVFNALNLAGVAVFAGALYFLVLRLRQRHEAGVTSAFHLAPLLILLVVAATGLALPLTGGLENRLYFRLAAIAHEAAVIVMLISLPYGKLIHVFIRPLHLGAQLVRAESVSRAHCQGCRTALGPAEQLEAVEFLLSARGFRFAGHQRLCPGCRRRGLATAHSQLLDGRFQPALTPAPRAARPPQARAA